MKIARSLRAIAACCLPFAGFPLIAHAQTKPPISLDEYMNTTDIPEARISPDGSAAVIETTDSDWQRNRYKTNLWLWTRESGNVVPLTNTGHDASAEFSPDGNTIAFLSDRPLPGGSSEEDSKEGDPSRVWLLPLHGGEAYPLYTDDTDTQSFAWSTDGTHILLATEDDSIKDAEDERKEQWKDVIRWREQETGDVLLSLPVAAALKASEASPQPHADAKAPENKTPFPAGAIVIAHSKLSINTILPSPTSDEIAFETESISRRLEDPTAQELFLVAAKGGKVRQLTHNEGIEDRLRWEPSGKSIDFLVAAASGSVEGPYTDVQGRIYSLDVASGKITRLGADFTGSWDDYTITANGTIIASGLTGMNQGLYRIDGAKFEAIGTVPGIYAKLDAAQHGSALLFVHSAITEPTQVFVAPALTAIDDTKPITNFNPIFAERAQVSFEPYTWTSDDGTKVEGVLIYPPGKKGMKHLRMLTFIHGGPADADGNRFGADWYDYATLCATEGWLVFRPNYRGSAGYGDAFILGIQPHMVSVPGRDILTGVDALVKDGIADPAHLTIGGYSYGGYMTNWLITQTTRFKAAVTGAGAVEHTANWGNDDDSFDDAWYLTGTPWEKPELYQSEAALFQITKVTTPTHIVGGSADVRVSYLEQVLLERALDKLKVPHSLLVFPGEGHSLEKDPWHGYIKVREELKWLQKYGAN